MAETVRIFPASGRTGDSEYNNWLSEYNLSSLINQLMGSQTGFVISDTIADDDPVEFNIKGYYFCVSTAKAIRDAAASSGYSEGCDLVKFSKSGDDYIAQIAITGEDHYKILSKPDTVTNSLTLFSYTKNEYKIPEDSRIQFSKLKTISGKNLTVTLNGNSITGYSFTATGDAKDVNSSCKIAVQDGKITSLVIDDGELA